jgi:hypothetical protein
MTAGVYDTNADHLLEFFRLLDGRIDNDIATFLAELCRWYGFHEFLL